MVDVAHVEWGRTDTSCRYPLAADELDAFNAALSDLGAEVIRTWNGHPAIPGSLALKQPAHPTLAAAVRQHHAAAASITPSSADAVSAAPGTATVTRRS